MTPIFQKILLFAFIPVLTMIVGGLIAIKNPPKALYRSAILHFAAGVLLSVVAVEMLPDILRRHLVTEVIIGFSMGTILMLLVRKFFEPTIVKGSLNKKRSTLPISFLVAIVIDMFIDGFVLGIGFASGVKLGMFLALGLAIELLITGIAVVTELGQANTPKLKSMIMIVGVALIFFISAILGGTLLKNLNSSGMTFVLSFGMAAELFLITEELLKEAHEEEENHWATATFYVGFLLFVVLEMVV